jgi:hypothetical protein
VESRKHFFADLFSFHEAFLFETTFVGARGLEQISDSRGVFGFSGISSFYKNSPEICRKREKQFVIASKSNSNQIKLIKSTEKIELNHFEKNPF